MLINKKFKELIKIGLTLAILSIGGSFFINAIFAQWTPPVAVPPGGNVDAILFEDPIFSDYTADQVGIGVSTFDPGYPLHVQDDNAMATINIDNEGTAPYLWTGVRLERDNTEKWFIGMNTTGDNLLFWRGGTTADMTIGATGNVAIPGLVSCDTIDTDASGILSCGTDDTGAGGATDKIYEGDSEVEVIDTGDGYIEFREDNTEIIRISGGNVGIGTINPAQRLEIGDDIGVARLRITDTDANDNPELQLQQGAGAGDHWSVYVENSDDSFRIWGTAAGGDNRLTISSAGALTLEDAIYNASCTKLYTNASGQVLCGSDQTGTGMPIGTSGQTLRYDATNNLVANSVIYNDGANVGIGVIGPVHRLELAEDTTAAGGIGFGTDVELYRGAANRLDLASGDSLNIKGRLQIAGTTVITSDRLAQMANGTAGGPAFSFIDDLNTGMYSGGTDILKLSTAGADRMTILANGNVGIGTTNPTLQNFVSAVTAGEVLQVRYPTAGASDAAQLYLNASTGGGGMSCGHNGRCRIGANAANWRTEIIASNQVVLTAHELGNVGIGITTPNNPAGTALHIYNATNNAEINIESDNLGVDHWSIRHDSPTDDLIFWKDGVDNISITDDGRITNVSTPTGANDAATKGYVDALGSGIKIVKVSASGPNTNCSITADCGAGYVISRCGKGTAEDLLAANALTYAQNTAVRLFTPGGDFTGSGPSSNAYACTWNEYDSQTASISTSGVGPTNSSGCAIIVECTKE